MSFRAKRELLVQVAPRYRDARHGERSSLCAWVADRVPRYGWKECEPADDNPGTENIQYFTSQRRRRPRWLATRTRAWELHPFLICSKH